MQKFLFSCPGCENDVYGAASIEMDLDATDGGSITASGTITGISVSHDCVPKVTR